jgi:branched-chain amino acid transport system substrate-binding protein
MVEFAKRFQAKYNTTCDLYAGMGWDIIHIVYEGLKAGGDDKAKIRDAIENLKNFQGMQGMYNYSATDHVGNHGGFAEWEVKNGVFTFMQALN